MCVCLRMLVCVGVLHTHTHAHKQLLKGNKLQIITNIRSIVLNLK